MAKFDGVDIKIVQLQAGDMIMNAELYAFAKNQLRDDTDKDILTELGKVPLRKVMVDKVGGNGTFSWSRDNNTKRKAIVQRFSFERIVEESVD